MIKGSDLPDDYICQRSVRDRMLVSSYNFFVQDKVIKQRIIIIFVRPLNKSYLFMNFSFLDFVMKNPWGIVLFPLVASIIGNLFYDAIKRIASSSTKSVKRQRFHQRIMRANNLFAESYKAGYAQGHSTLHQNLFVGGYIIEIVFKVFIVLLIALGASLLLFLLRDYPWAFILILGITCATITVLVKRLIGVIKQFKEITHFVFGADYYKKEEELIARFWMLKNKGMKDDDIFKLLDFYSQRD